MATEFKPNEMTLSKSPYLEVIARYDGERISIIEKRPFSLPSKVTVLSTPEARLLETFLKAVL